MSWREEISAGLQPTPTPPEGSDAAQVRRDIIDELTDHLDCAMRRELRKTDDENIARRAVLKRFGDPTRIACRLWFDAMKESIMSQRISLITNVVLAIACITVCIFALLAMQRNSQLTEAMLARMEAIGSEGQTPVASEIWAEATLTVRRGSADGPPVEGLRVIVYGEMFNPGKTEDFDARTDADGSFSIGPVRPGSYRVQIFGSGLSHLREVVFYPGRNEFDPVIWPMPPETKPAEVSLDFTMPEELQEDGVTFLICTFGKRPRGGEPEVGTWDRRGEIVILMPDSRAMRITDDNWPFGDPIDKQRSKWPLYLDRIRPEEQINLDSSYIYRLEAMEAVSMKSPADAAQGDYWKLRAGISDTGRIRCKLTPDTHSMRSPQLARAGEQWFDAIPDLEITPDGPNVWRVEIPDWFVEHALDALEYLERQKERRQRNSQ